jgi:hypothetical protein
MCFMHLTIRTLTKQIFRLKRLNAKVGQYTPECNFFEQSKRVQTHSCILLMNETSSNLGA